MQVLKRGEKIKGKLSTTWNQFSYLPRSLTSTAASEKREQGSVQGTTHYWECTHFQEQSHIQLEEDKCPPCEYSLKRTSTNLIQSWGAQCYSERPAHNGHCFFCSSTVRKKAPRWMLPGMKYTETGGTRLHWNRSPNRREPGITRAESPFANAVMELGRRRTSLTLHVLIMDWAWRNMTMWCLPFLGSQLHHRNSWTSSGAAAKRREKSVVEGVAMDPMECRVSATVSVKEACLL